MTQFSHFESLVYALHNCCFALISYLEKYEKVALVSNFLVTKYNLKYNYRNKSIYYDCITAKSFKNYSRTAKIFKKQMKMTPQCNPMLHYTKQPLLSPHNQVAVVNAAASKKLKQKDRKKREKNRIKCVIVGDKQVGKTSLAVSYSNDSFPSEYVPTAYDNYNVDVQVDGKPIRLDICDTAGEDNLAAPLRHLCYPGADVFMLCFSVVRPSSFTSAFTRWADELTRLGVPVVLVGCQADLVNNEEVLKNLRWQNYTGPVPLQNARELAQRLNATYVETSAKTCNHLKKAFDEAIIIALKRRQERDRRKWWKKWCCWKS